MDRYIHQIVLFEFGLFWRHVAVGRVLFVMVRGVIILVDIIVQVVVILYIVRSAAPIPILA